jgi:uncharacterized protein YecE (DUF72 family)
VEGNKDRAIFWAKSFEKTCVKPLAEEGLLGGALLQLSPYFKNEDTALDALKGVLDAVSYQDFDYAVEFRHKSWLGREQEGDRCCNLGASERKECCQCPD